MAAPEKEDCPISELDNFKGVYKKYKRRDRPLDVSDVIDFSTSHFCPDQRVEKISLNEPMIPQFPGMKPVSEWNAYQLKNCEGFIVIPNPFIPKYQRYWIQRCLLDFPVKPNRTNLDAHMERPSQVWHQCVDGSRPDLGKDSLLMKLRWATLGFQYEWNTKEYFADRIQAFPDDLKHICSYIASTLGYSSYSSEAGIVNYYRMESTLMGHTDVSELDKAAPLISFSFGQSCIFLIGGPTKATEPIPLFLNSGDICLMTGHARLSYHAVPRILPGQPKHLSHCFYGDELGGENCGEESKTCDNNEVSTEINYSEGDSGTDVAEDIDPYSDTRSHKPPMINVIKSDESVSEETIIVTPTVQGNKCTVEELEVLMNDVIENTDWTPFDKYLSKSRVNVNVRQVLKAGLSLGMSPETIPQCQRNCAKK
ncbi:Nucleic acid dioxygenase alkbh1 [Mactra antiquata]